MYMSETPLHESLAYDFLKWYCSVTPETQLQLDSITPKEAEDFIYNVCLHDTLKMVHYLRDNRCQQNVSQSDIAPADADNTSTVVKVGKFPGFNQEQQCNVLVIGRRGYGKTTLLNDLVAQFPERKVVRINNEQELFLFVEEQKAKSRRGEAEDVSLVMNDCLCPDQMCNTAFKELLLNGRHYKVNVFVAFQYAVKLLPQLRTQFDYVFALKAEYHCHRKLLHNHYFAGAFAKYKEFEQVFSEVTSEPYNSLVIEWMENTCWYYCAPAPKTTDVVDEFLNTLADSLPFVSQLSSSTSDFAADNCLDVAPQNCENKSDVIHFFPGFDQKQQCNIAVIGKRNTGKTELLHYLSSLFPERTAITIQHLHELELNMLEQKQKYEDGCAEDLIFIIDDLAVTMFAENEENILKTAKNYKVSIFLALQFPTQIKPLSREHIDYVFALQEDYSCAIKNLYTFYFEELFHFGTYKEFEDAFSELTSLAPCSAMVADFRLNTCWFHHWRKPCERKQKLFNKIENAIRQNVDISTIKLVVDAMSEYIECEAK